MSKMKDPDAAATKRLLKEQYLPGKYSKPKISIIDDDENLKQEFAQSGLSNMQTRNDRLLAKIEEYRSKQK